MFILLDILILRRRKRYHNPLLLFQRLTEFSESVLNCIILYPHFACSYSKSPTHQITYLLVKCRGSCAVDKFICVINKMWVLWLSSQSATQQRCVVRWPHTCR